MIVVKPVTDANLFPILHYLSYILYINLFKGLYVTTAFSTETSTTTTTNISTCLTIEEEYAEENVTYSGGQGTGMF